MKPWAVALFVLPAAALALAFVAVPLLAVARLSFFRTDFIRWASVGFGNYRELVASGTVFLNSLIYVLIMVPVATGVPLLISFALMETPKWVQPVARFALYTPAVTAGIIISQAWRWIFHPSIGLVNQILGTHIVWFSDRWTSIPVIAGIIALTGFGPTVLLYSAAILAVDGEILQQATIDGASRRQTKWRIIAPIIWPTISLIMLLATASALQHFETLFTLAPYDYAENLMFGVYRNAFQFGRFGFAAAETMILVAVSAAVIGLKQRVTG